MARLLMVTSVGLRSWVMMLENRSRITGLPCTGPLDLPAARMAQIIIQHERQAPARLQSRGVHGKA